MRYFVGVVTFQPEQENVMSNDSKYSIKLANGKERAFGSAAAMAKWIDEQRELKVPRRKGVARKPNRKPERKVRCYSGDSPLARYANRNSDET